MKDLRSKEQSHYEINTSLTKGSAYNPSIYKPYMDYPPPPPPFPPPLFYKKMLISPFMIFQKSHSLYK